MRYISNFSTGKMAFALADEAARRGAEVTVVAGPTTAVPSHKGVKVVRVESALEMLAACRGEFPGSDVAIMCAAVADYRVKNPADTKIKREGHEPPALELVANPDIAATLGAEKRPGQILVGFALETDNGPANALGKMERKNLDMVVLNSLADKGAGFATDTNRVAIFRRGEEEPMTFPLKPKTEVAADILNAIESL